MRKLRLIKLWITLGLVMVVVVIFFSICPLLVDVTISCNADKIAHLFVYSLLMLWFGCIYNPGMVYRKLGLGLIFMGIILEVIQGTTAYRSMEYLDMLANSFGVLAGWLLSKTLLSSTLEYLERRLGIQEN